MEGQGDGRHNGPNCYRIPLPIGNGARNMETLGLRVFILNQEIIFSIHAMIRPPDNDAPDDDDGNTEDNDEDENEDDENVEDDAEEDEAEEDDVEREENMENAEDEDEMEDSDGDADAEDDDAEDDERRGDAHPDYHADNPNLDDVHLNDDNAVLLFRIRVRPLQHGDVFDDIFLELRLVNNDDFDEIDNNEERNGDANADNVDVDDDDGFENDNSDDRDRSREGDGALEDADCCDDEGFEDIERDGESVRDCAVVAAVVDEEAATDDDEDAVAEDGESERDVGDDEQLFVDTRVQYAWLRFAWQAWPLSCGDVFEEIVFEFQGIGQEDLAIRAYNAAWENVEDGDELDVQDAADGERASGPADRRPSPSPAPTGGSEAEEIDREAFRWWRDFDYDFSQSVGIDDADEEDPPPAPCEKGTRESAPEAEPERKAALRLDCQRDAPDQEEAWEEGGARARPQPSPGPSGKRSRDEAGLERESGRTKRSRRRSERDASEDSLSGAAAGRS
ncbi:serine-aspartate repeat-containing protein I-like isoform X1 [Hippocampus zosterae]|uniref:serine-aspartate repeat-containing protein I-like isoform X1 n=1 Tax=Hippocampus zosterae TaxID=109293 RepID=UPI00223CB9A9|nr:serine-aspartate repeat-containing protein I-like isoform X1 [Hippocampus zosterae]